MFAAGKTASPASAANYIEEVFGTYLYTGNSSTQTITNGIDLAGKGGMVWVKSRSDAYNGWVFDTQRGANKYIVTNLTSDQGNDPTLNWSFLSNGFSQNNNQNSVNLSGTTYVSWTFRKQAKFFDVVTYTGDGNTSQTINHNLGSTPGCIIVKNLSISLNWFVYHTSIGATKHLNLNTTSSATTSSASWNDTSPTSTQFTVGANSNTASNTYVAYLFAHDAGGFGAAGTDNVISCGSYTSNGSTISVNLGWEPQWILIKRSSNTGNWCVTDNMRGMTAATANASAPLFPNLSDAELAASSTNGPAINATGFTVPYSSSAFNYPSGETYIYIAIRRGPMKTPTSGTSVFSPVVYTGTNVDNRLVDMSLLTDMAFVRQRNDTVLGGMVVGDRLRGDPYLLTGTTAAEVSDADSFMTPTAGYGNSWSAMNGFGVGNDATSKLNASTTSNNQIAEGFRRAPGFFDVVCYTGTGSFSAFNHNLTVTPEFFITKDRANASTWYVYHKDIGVNNYLVLNTTAASAASSNWIAVTSTTFSINLTSTWVAYLFATVTGVSKVGSYTGTGTTLQIDCGFTNGARFVLIKRTDSTGDWYVWDSARGIVAGDDPYLLLNSTAAEVTNTDYIDTSSAGFEISSTAPAAINANGGTFIFLAIA